MFHEGAPMTVTDSYRYPLLSNWWRLRVEPILERFIAEARRTLGYRVEDDCFASSELGRLLHEAAVEGRLVDARTLCTRIRGRVCIAGGGAGLEAVADRLDGLCDTIIAVDGATSLLNQYDINIDVVVSDLDGRWSGLLQAAQRGAATVVHAHGDNLPAVKLLVPMMPGLIGVSQCRRRSLWQLPLLGFTDGDKAVGLALGCGATRLLLAGMEFDGPTGWWSKHWLTHNINPWREKKVKLRFAARITRFLLSMFPGAEAAHLSPSAQRGSSGDEGVLSRAQP